MTIYYNAYCNILPQNVITEKILKKGQTNTEIHPHVESVNTVSHDASSAIEEQPHFDGNRQKFIGKHKT